MKCDLRGLNDLSNLYQSSSCENLLKLTRSKWLNHIVFSNEGTAIVL